MKNIFALFLLLLAFNQFVAVEAAYAKKIELPAFVTKEDVKSTTNTIAENLAAILFSLAGVVFVLSIITGAIRISDDDLEGGLKRIKNALLGGGGIAIFGAIAYAFT